MKKISVRKGYDWFLILVVNFMWATQVPVIRLIGDRLSAITIAFIPMILSTIFFLPVLMLENKKRNVAFKWRWTDIRHFILPGFIGIFLMQYAYTVGAQKTLAANAGIITLTIPVLVAILASVMLKEKLNVVRVISFLIAIAGVLITSANDIAGVSFGQSKLLQGNLIFLGACGCCAFFNTYCKLLVDRHYTELEILVYSSLVATICTIPVFIWIEPFSFQTFVNAGIPSMAAILELSIIVYGVSMLLFFSVLKRMDVTQAILGCYLLPLFIALLGLILLHETMTGWMIFGGCLVLVSTLMVTIYEEPLKKFFKLKQKNSEATNSLTIINHQPINK